jgi:hypothetical protein
MGGGWPTAVVWVDAAAWVVAGEAWAGRAIRSAMNLFLQPANQLTVLQKEPEIDGSDDDDRRFFYTTAARWKVKDPTHQDFDAKWGYRLVAEGKIRRNKI